MYPKNRKKKQNERLDALQYSQVEDLQSVPIAHSLEDNKKMLANLFHDSTDFVVREFQIEKTQTLAIAVFIDGLVNSLMLNEAMKSLMILEGDVSQVEILKHTTLPVSQVEETTNYSDLVLGVLGGDTGIIVDKQQTALILGIRGAQTRSISEPETEAVVRGPREGFVENLRTNTSMLRRKLKTPRLKIKSMTIGQESNTDVSIAYLENIADPETVKEVISRLEKIKIDGILESGYIEELIQDSTYSPFPQVQYTERPDTTAASLLEGRVAIITDGTPFVLIVPTVFWQFMQASEDYYERFQLGTLLRWLRYVFLVFSLLTPALYVAITTYHQDMLPTTLLLSIAAARESIPFPAFIEALIMEVTFEALREAGIRLPKAIGQAVSILGALVVGQAAVEAGIVSAPMVIVVSITGIASFTVPRFNAAISIRMLRFPIMFAAACFGIFGVLLSVMVLIGHMAGLRSFGVPYLSPLAPLSVKDLKDVLVRSPLWALGNRPSFLDVQDPNRLGGELVKEIKQQRGQKGMEIEHEDDNSEGETSK